MRDKTHVAYRKTPESSQPGRIRTRPEESDEENAKKTDFHSQWNWHRDNYFDRDDKFRAHMDREFDIQ